MEIWVRRLPGNLIWDVHYKLAKICTPSFLTFSVFFKWKTLCLFISFVFLLPLCGSDWCIIILFLFCQVAVGILRLLRPDSFLRLWRYIAEWRPGPHWRRSRQNVAVDILSPVLATKKSCDKNSTAAFCRLWLRRQCGRAITHSVYVVSEKDWLYVSTIGFRWFWHFFGCTCAESLTLFSSSGQMKLTNWSRSF